MNLLSEDVLFMCNIIKRADFFYALLISFLFIFNANAGQSESSKHLWQPSAGHRQIPIWPKGEIPNQQHFTVPETMRKITKPLVAGKPWLSVGPVYVPTMTVYTPKGINMHAAVLVFPGGGYWVLAMDLEGSEICNWITAQGMTCVLLTYRVPGEDSQGKPLGPKTGPYPNSPIALEDAQRAMGLVRFNAKAWHINPNKIGVIGFSAGGSLVAEISTHFKKRIYQSIDAADKISCRPDFAITVYPGHLWINHKKFTLNPNIPVTALTPPTFILQAENDPVDNINNSLVYYISLKKAGVPVEMHLYAKGGHAFGLRETKLAITKWPNLVISWLHSIGIIDEKNSAR